jgi:hypothetical protein
LMRGGGGRANGRGQQPLLAALSPPGLDRRELLPKP